MKKFKLFIFTIFFLSVESVFSQAKITESQKLIENGKYDEALEILMTVDDGNQANSLIIICYLNLIIQKDISYINRNQLFEEMKTYIEKSENYSVEADINEKIMKELIQKKVILQNQGISFYNEQKLKSALSVMEMAYYLSEESGDKDTTLAFNIAVIADGQNDISNTVKYLEICINEGVKRMDIILLLIDKYKKLNDEKKLYEILKKAGNYYPSEIKFIKEEVNIYMQQKEYGKALQRLEEMTNKGINDIELILLKATLYENNGDLDNAETSYKKVIKLDEGNIHAYYRLGTLNLDNAIIHQNITNVSNDYMQKAKIYLEKANTLDPKNIEVLQSLSQLYSLTGDFDKFETVKKQLDILQ